MNEPGISATNKQRRRLIVAGVLGVVGVVAIVVGLQGPASPAEPEPSPRLATPVWSARRVPGPVLAIVGTERLRNALDGGAEGTDSCYVVSGPNGLIVESAPDTPRVPASTLKLLTATAALDVMGPDFKYETHVVAAAKPRDGTLERAWLVGAGDPMITTPEAADQLAADPLTKGDAITPLVKLADDIVAAGVRAIPGGVVADDSRYDTTRYLSVWPTSYRADREIGPIGALTVNDGFGGPAGAGAATDPTINAADQLARLLILRGVSVGPSTRGTAPKDSTTIATLESPPLHDIVTAFLASSDNLTAEMLAREIAARSDQPATTANGTAAITAKLGNLGLPTEGLVMVDGSGLARQDRATCALLVATLNLASTPKFATLRDSLAVAGERGTLATRLQGTPLQGKLVAKTGSLSGVSGLAGYVSVKQPITFSLLLNGRFGESTGTVVREEMAQAIGRYPDVPTADVLVPLPAAPIVP
jgi:D-alanyl-D-alanine carboxypeptidase/D-alanyl-D-alanine-endopeptidase (penicillin-binding protein 4)